MNEKRQLRPRQRSRAFRSVHPTEREVLLARLLLHLVDVLGTKEDLDVDLYNGVKAIAEPIVREVRNGSPQA